MSLWLFGCDSEDGLSQLMNGVRSSLCKCGTRNESMTSFACVCACVRGCVCVRDGMPLMRCESDLPLKIMMFKIPH